MINAIKVNLVKSDQVVNNEARKGVSTEMSLEL